MLLEKFNVLLESSILLIIETSTPISKISVLDLVLIFSSIKNEIKEPSEIKRQNKKRTINFNSNLHLIILYITEKVNKYNI